jgi:phosphoesterase RecJ-like protein
VLEERQALLPRPILVLDHHLTQQDWADVKLVDTTAAAAGEIAHRLIADLGVGLDRPIATCLYAAIASDTGWFQFSNTTPRTMRIAAELMEAGVDADRMYQLLFQNERHQRLAIQTRAMQSLELLADHRLAVMTLRGQDLVDCDADAADTENLINIPMQVRTVELSVLISEPRRPPGPVRVSFRSKGQVDVARFAERFGGGGHARASGAKFDRPVDQVREVVVKALLEELSPMAKPNGQAPMPKTQ